MKPRYALDMARFALRNGHHLQRHRVAGHGSQHRYESTFWRHGRRLFSSHTIVLLIERGEARIVFDEVHNA